MYRIHLAIMLSWQSPYAWSLCWFVSSHVIPRAWSVRRSRGSCFVAATCGSYPSIEMYSLARSAYSSRSFFSFVYIASRFVIAYPVPHLWLDKYGLSARGSVRFHRICLDVCFLRVHRLSSLCASRNSQPHSRGRTRSYRVTIKSSPRALYSSPSVSDTVISPPNVISTFAYVSSRPDLHRQPRFLSTAINRICVCDDMLASCGSRCRSVLSVCDGTIILNELGLKLIQKELVRE